MFVLLSAHVAMIQRRRTTLVEIDIDIVSYLSPVLCLIIATASVFLVLSARRVTTASDADL